MKAEDAHLPDTVLSNEPFEAIIFFYRSCSSGNRFTFEAFSDTISIHRYKTGVDVCTPSSNIDSIKLSIKIKEPGIHYFKFNDKNFYNYHDLEFLDSVYVQ